MTGEGEPETPMPIVTGDRIMVPHSPAIAKLLGEPQAVQAKTVPLPVEIQAQTVASLMQADGWHLVGDFIVKNGVATFDLRKGQKSVTVTLGKAAFDSATPQVLADKLIKAWAGT